MKTSDRCNCFRGEAKNFVELTDPVTKKIKDNCKGAMAPPEIKMISTGMVICKRFLTIAETIRNMEVKPDDVWIISHPKAG